MSLSQKVAFARAMGIPATDAQPPEGVYVGPFQTAVFSLGLAVTAGQQLLDLKAPASWNDPNLALLGVTPAGTIPPLGFMFSGVELLVGGALAQQLDDADWVDLLSSMYIRRNGGGLPETFFPFPNRAVHSPIDRSQTLQAVAANAYLTVAPGAPGFWYFPMFIPNVQSIGNLALVSNFARTWGAGITLDACRLRFHGIAFPADGDGKGKCGEISSNASLEVGASRVAAVVGVGRG
jgi:hypothetical protein